MDPLRILHGQVTCTGCNQTSMALWRLERGDLICDGCGGVCVPVGVQQADAVPALLLMKELMRIEHAAMRRLMS